MSFRAASEPTNIIWENRHIRGINYIARFFLAIIFLTMLICGAFFLIYLAKYQSIQNTRAYSGVNCDEYKEEILTQNPNWFMSGKWNIMKPQEGFCKPKSRTSILGKQPKNIQDKHMTEALCIKACKDDWTCDAAEWNSSKDAGQ